MLQLQQNWRLLLRTYLNDILAINTALLVGMRVFGATTGFLYWALAARAMSAAEVGIASGVVAASSLLAGLAQIGLGYGLVRHLPHANNRSALINLSIFLTAGIAAILAFGFLVTLELWSPSLVSIRHDPALAALFVVLTISTTATMLFQWIFMALGRLSFSVWKLSIQSILAIVFLVALLPLMAGAKANLAAYTLATVLGVAICFWPMLSWAEPGYRWSFDVRSGFQSSFANYSLLNFAADQFQRAPDTLLPLLIIQQFGVEQGAYFFIVWTIGRGMVAWVFSIAESLFAAGSRQPDQIGAYLGRALRIGLGLSLGLVGGTFVFGRLLLSLYGQQYVEQGSALLNIVTLSALPGVFIYTIVSMLRVQRRLRAVSVIMALSAAGGLIGCVVGMQSGFTGIGVGWLVSQVAVLCGVAVWWFGQRRVVVSGARL